MPENPLGNRRSIQLSYGGDGLADWTLDGSRMTTIGRCLGDWPSASVPMVYYRILLLRLSNSVRLS